MIIFKYLNEEGGIETLKNNSVLLRTPNEYNDPFDCLFYTTKEEKEKGYKLYLNYLFFKEIYDEIILKKPNKRKLSHVAKAYIPLFKKEVEKIKISKKYEYQSYLSIFVNLAKIYLHKDAKQLKRGFNELVDSLPKKMRSNLLCSCFGSINNSILMWSHYADKHRGICVEFEIDDKDFKQMKYQDNLPTFNLVETLSYLFGHELFGEELDTEKEEFQFIIEPLLIKSRQWSYEGEIRCAYSKNKRDSKIYDSTDKEGNNLFLLRMPAIKSIYIGCSATDEFKEKVKKLCPQTPIYKMEKMKNQYGITSKRIN